MSFSQNAALGLREAGVLSTSVSEGQGRQNVGGSGHRREVCSCHQEQESDSSNTNQTSTTHTHTPNQPFPSSQSIQECKTQAC